MLNGIVSYRLPAQIQCIRRNIYVSSYVQMILRGHTPHRPGQAHDRMNRIIRFVALLIYVALLIIWTPPTTTADEGQDERAAVSGSVWIIPTLPEQLTIFEIKPDGTVKAGRWGFAGMAKESIWTGTFRNGRLELTNQRLAEAPLIYPEYGPPSETITATIVDSQITGHYKYTGRALNAFDDREFTGYCLNCLAYGSAVAGHYPRTAYWRKRRASAAPQKAWLGRWRIAGSDRACLQ